MSDYSVIAEREIYPLLFDNPNAALSEFEFKKRGNHWISGNDLKVDGSRGGEHKVYIYPDRPHYLKDFTRGGTAITTYLQQQGICESWPKAIEHLARIYGVSLPTHNLGDEAIEAIKKKEKQKELFETINDFFITSLLEEKGGDADAFRKHLHEDRGYSDYLPKSHDEIHANNKMELGFFPSREKLKDYLKSVDIESDVIESLFIKDTGSFHMKSCGSTHQLTIPYRDHSGQIVGFIFRNINHKKSDEIQKYLCSYGLSRKETLFKLAKTKELTLIEGYLDVMRLKTLNVDNVAALGGVGLNADQVKLAKQMGAESITLWLDRDSTGAKSTDSAIEIINKSNTGIKTYVVEIPSEYKKKNSDDQIKDPDELIRDYGIDAYHTVIKTARSWYIYHLDKLLNCIEGILHDKERDKVFNEINKLAFQLSPVDREVFCQHLFNRGSALGISPETLKKAMDKLKYEINEEKIKSDLRCGLNQSLKFLDEGKREEAVTLISEASKKAKNSALESSYQALLTPITEVLIANAIKNKPDHVISGFKISNEDLLIPSGAITIVAAPTSHGKTTLLGNMGINIATQINSKPVYLFSYEENREAILLKLLNTYINKPLSKNNRRSIESYFKNGDMEYISSIDDMRETFIYEKDKFFRSLIQSGKLNVFYSDYTSDDLIGAIHYLHKQNKVGTVLIDYVQLLRLKNNKSNSRQEEVKQICIDLKDCAVETGLPIVLGAQFNRTVTQKVLIHQTAIGEAGDIERIANMIIGLWNNQFPDLGDKNPKLSDTMDAFILKDRDGGMAGMNQIFSFNGNTGKISNHLVEVKKSFGTQGRSD